MASNNWAKVEEVVQSAATAKNAFLVDLVERRDGVKQVIQVFVDTDEGITIAQCAEISRELGVQFDALNLFDERYELEVSSPGIEKPLRFLRQYKKNVGRIFEVHYWHEKERRAFKGTLVAVDGEQLTFSTDETISTVLDFSRIIESIEALPW